MFRALTTLAAIVALAVSAAPASAGLLSSPLGLTTKPKPAVYDHGITQGRKPPPRGTAGSTLIGEVAFPKARGAGVIESLSQKYTASALDAVGKEPLF